MVTNFALFALLYSCFAQQPNILFIYVDDVGFNDFGFNQNTQTQTPFIDNLVNTESLLIEQNYVSFVCSPTRAQMLTGRYASKLGLQHNVFSQNVPYSLTRQVSLLSNEFQSSGYSTHLIGKFHLGFQAWEYTPTYRGFDTFSGFYNGEETYFSHMSYVKNTDLIYYDLRNNEEPDTDVENYSVYVQRDRFVTLLDDIHTNENPFFIYLAFQAAHFPPQAPVEYASKYCNPSDETQDNIGLMPKTVHPPYHSDDDATNGDDYLSGDCTTHDLHMAQMTSIDDAMEVIVNKMKDLNIWDNTIVVFSSDNGAAMFSGDNAPLRGGKTTPFEGGVRVPAFVSGGYLNENRRGQRLSAFPVHATDWYPTLLSAANLEIKYERSKRLYTPDIDENVIDTKWDYIDDNDIEIGLDGMSIWNAIQYNVIDDELMDREILLHLDEIDCTYSACGAIRYSNWKFMRGPYICDGSAKCGWNNEWMTDADNNILRCPMVTDDERITKLVHGQKDSEYDLSGMTCADGCLFDLDTDPCEMNDVKDDYPDIVAMMEDKLLFWQKGSVVPLMGANEVVLDDDEIRPTVVCDSEYWCPFQQYDDVEFETTLHGEYLRLYGAVDNDQTDKMIHLFGDALDTKLLCVIGLFTFIGGICALYAKISKKKNDMKETYQESAPLL